MPLFTASHSQSSTAQKTDTVWMGNFIIPTAGENLNLLKGLHLINVSVVMTDFLLNGRKNNTEGLNHLITDLEMTIFGKIDHHMTYFS